MNPFTPDTVLVTLPDPTLLPPHLLPHLNPTDPRQIQMSRELLAVFLAKRWVVEVLGPAYEMTSDGQEALSQLTSPHLTPTQETA